MKRKEIQKIDSLLQSFVKTNNLEKGLAEYRLIKSWKDLLGITVSKKINEAAGFDVIDDIVLK